MAHAHKLIGDMIGWSKIDVVAGGETAGIPFSAFIAQTAKKPMIYVRKQPKGFGRMAQIEGELNPGQRVLLVEDLATDGGSKVMFIEALRKADAKVTDCFVIFHYGIFQQSVDTLSMMGVKLHALATWWDVLDAAERHKYFDAQGLTETRAFLESPDGWSATHGGAGQRPNLIRPPAGAMAQPPRPLGAATCSATCRSMRDPRTAGVQPWSTKTSQLRTRTRAKAAAAPRANTMPASRNTSMPAR